MHLLPITDVDKGIIDNFSCVFHKYSQEQEELYRDHEKIDYFLKELALAYHLNHLARTFLLLNKDKNRVIGFFSLYNEEIAISSGKEKSFKYKGLVLYKPPNNDVFPSIRLHQLAIDQEFHGQIAGELKFSDY